MSTKYLSGGNQTMAAASVAQLYFKEVLSVRTVRRLWIAQLVSIFGDFLAIFAVFSIVTFQLHGTPMQVAMILVAYMLPLAVVSPLAGVFVDKWNVRWTMIGSDVIRGLMVLTLLFERDLYVIYGTFLLLSTVSAFFVPAQSVAVRTLAPPNGLMTVNALMSQAMQGSQIISPAIAGLLVQGMGANSCFLLDSLSFSRVGGAGILAHHQAGGDAGGHRGRHRAALADPGISIHFHSFGDLVRDALHGFRDVRHALLRRAALGLRARHTAQQRGALRHAEFDDRHRHDHRDAVCSPHGAQSVSQHMVSGGVAGMGAMVLLTASFGLVSTTALGMLGLGFSAAFIFITAQTLIQQETPGAMLGRVISSLMSLMAISQVVAMFVAGPVAQRAGIRNLYFGSAALLMGIGLFQYAEN